MMVAVYVVTEDRSKIVAVTQKEPDCGDMCNWCNYCIFCINLVEVHGRPSHVHYLSYTERELREKGLELA